MHRREGEPEIKEWNKRAKGWEERERRGGEGRGRRNSEPDREAFVCHALPLEGRDGPPTQTGAERWGGCELREASLKCQDLPPAHPLRTGVW